MGVALCLCTMFQAQAQFNVFKPNVEDDAPWQEGALVFPSQPAEADLVPFEVSASPHRFAVDARSINLNPQDGVTRFTLIISTSGGAVNVTYEGIRCVTREHRTLGYGKKDQTWAALKTTWRRVGESGLQRHYAELIRLHVCGENGETLSAREIIANLRRLR